MNHDQNSASLLYQVSVYVNYSLSFTNHLLIGNKWTSKKSLILQN